MNENFEIEVLTAASERNFRRLWILCIILIVLLTLTIGGCIWYESQFEDVVTTTETYQDVDSGEGGNATIYDGVHVNGEDTSGNKKNGANKTP